MSRQTERPKDASEHGRAIHDKRIRRFVESQPDGIAELVAINVFDFGSDNRADGRSADANGRLPERRPLAAIRSDRLRDRSTNYWHALRSVDADSHGG